MRARKEPLPTRRQTLRFGALSLGAPPEGRAPAPARRRARAIPADRGRPAGPTPPPGPASAAPPTATPRVAGPAVLAPARSLSGRLLFVSDSDVWLLEPGPGPAPHTGPHQPPAVLVAGRQADRPGKGLRQRVRPVGDGRGRGQLGGADGLQLP